MQKIKFSQHNAHDPFFRDLRSLLPTVLEHDGPDLKFWLKALFFFILCWTTYALIIVGIIKGVFAFMGAIVIGLSGLLVGFSIGHDASHRVISKKKWINSVFHYISFLSIGIDPVLWGLRHIRSHHICPNVHGSDIDIDKNPLLRLSPDHPWRPLHRYQHYYAPFAYMLALVHSVFWGDWVYLLSSDYAWMRRGISLHALWLSFVSFKLIHFALMLGAPLMATDYSLFQIVTTYLFAGSISSVAFIVMLVGTHFFDGAEFPKPSSAGELATSWARHNLITSCDWNPDSGIARFFSGGANCHAAHHLFPHVCHTHYGKLVPLIRTQTARHGVEYHSMGLSQMIISHFRLLKRLAIPPG